MLNTVNRVTLQQRFIDQKDTNRTSTKSLLDLPKIHLNNTILVVRNRLVGFKHFSYSSQAYALEQLHIPLP